LIRAEYIGDVYAINGTSKILESGTDGTDATFTGDVTGNADTATTWASTVDLQLFGEVTSSAFALDGSGNVIINDTVVANFDERAQDAVAAAFAAGTHAGLTITYTDSSNKIDVVVNDPEIAITGAVAGSATMTALGNVSIATTQEADSVTLGTHTTGDYVANLVAGTGVTLDVTTGEGHTPTVTVENVPNASLDNSSITITDNQGTPNSETVDLGDTITFAGSNVIDVAVSATNTVTMSHDTSGVTSGVYGSGSIPSFSVDDKGHITSAVDNNYPSPTVTLTGSVTGAATLAELGDGSITTTLQATTGDLSDVDITGGVNNLNVLAYDTNVSKWVPYAIPGLSTPTLQAVTDSGAVTTTAVEFSGGVTTDGVTADGAVLALTAATVSFSGNVSAAAGTVTATEFSGPIKGDVTSTDGNDTLLVDAANAEIDYANVVNGPIIEQSTEFYLNSSQPGGGAITGTNFIGRTPSPNTTNLGSWFEVTNANRGTNGFGPGSTTYDPTLTGIAWHNDSYGFRGFEQGSTYEINVTLVPAYSGFTVDRLEEFEISATSLTTVLTKTKASVVVNSTIDAASTVHASITATFEDATANNNFVQIKNLQNEQQLEYFITEAFIKIKKIV
jgi:hypothetical protein